jgi:uridylate kinase
VAKTKQSKDPKENQAAKEKTQITYKEILQAVHGAPAKELSAPVLHINGSQLPSKDTFN